MIAFDTNVLLRLLLDDDETQSGQVEAIVGQVAEAGDSALERYRMVDSPGPSIDGPDNNKIQCLGNLSPFRHPLYCTSSDWFGKPST